MLVHDLVFSLTLLTLSASRKGVNFTVEKGLTLSVEKGLTLFVERGLPLSVNKGLTLLYMS